MTDRTMQLLRAANPVRDCDAPDFDRLLARLEDEPSERAAADHPLPRMRGRFVLLTRTKAPRIAIGRSALAVLAPIAVAVAVAAIAIVSLHASPAGRHGAPPPSRSLAYPPGQARGRVVAGSMHLFGFPSSGPGGQTWGAEWFRTTAGQICVQAGREVGRQLGYVGIDGLRPADDRFHAWAPNTAVDARCIAQPTHGGVALMVVELVPDSGYPAFAAHTCATASSHPCTTTLEFGILGSSAALAGYGTERHSESVNIGPGPDGEYITALPTATNACSVSRRGCHARFPLPSRRAFVDYAGARGTCVLRGPGTDGVLSGDCPYGLTIGPSPLRLTAAEVRTPVSVDTMRRGHTIAVTARFHTRVASSRLSEYELQLSTPTRCPPPAGATNSSLPPGPGFHAGQLLTIHGTVHAPCSGTYHGAVVLRPLVGSPLTVARFSFKQDHAR